MTKKIEILPEYTEVVYKGEKCFIMGDDRENSNETLSDLNYYIKFANSREDLDRKIKTEGWYDRMVLWNEVEHIDLNLDNLELIEKPEEKLLLENISTEALLAELDKRKHIIVPELIKTINQSINELKKFGVEILYDEDNDYSLTKIEKVGYNKYETLFNEIEG